MRTELEERRLLNRALTYSAQVFVELDGVSFRPWPPSAQRNPANRFGSRAHARDHGADGHFASKSERPPTRGSASAYVRNRVD